SKKAPECVEANHYSGTETQDGNSDEGSYSQCDADGFREVRSKKNVKERQKDEKDKPSMQHPRVMSKSEKDSSAIVPSRS
ncbi:hypothetical protein NL476_28235, partial [Klebsiella pneumoniae]|nr:hypothetical protein [Klebsiella pneumoniae]